MKMIKPTIGRRVWYWPSAQDRGETENPTASIIQQGDKSQPCDAGIAYVHSDRLINLTVADHNGVMHSRTSVTLMQEGDEIPQGFYAQWMHY
jgi:hypothetical protein